VSRAVRGQPPLSPQLLLHLQATAGNQAVRRLVEGQAATRAVVLTQQPAELVVAPVTVSEVPLRLSLWQWLLRRLRWRRLAVTKGEAPACCRNSRDDHHGIGKDNG
jgi:hypothetical protein